jgi:hypothetical protein
MAKKICRITTEDDFFSEYDGAKAAIDFADSEGLKDDVRWFFSDAMVNHQEKTASVTFKSYKTPEYRNHSLSVSVKKDQHGKWICAIAQKTKA